MKFLLLLATAASALDYLSSLKTPTAPSVRAPPATPASVPATREELVAQWRAACDVEVTSYADFGLRVAPAKAPLEAVVAAPARNAPPFASKYPINCQQPNTGPPERRRWKLLNSCGGRVD